MILPSGAKLKVQLSPFAVSKALYQAVFKELKNINFTTQTEMASVIKDAFCVAMSSPEIESCLWACMARCTLNDVRITPDTFEPLERREDYLKVCVEVGKANVMPFMKDLTQLYSQVSAAMQVTPE